jgi:hypothetical protein
MLAPYSPLTIFLKVDEEAIMGRISKSSEHRGSDYFRSRGGTPAEIAEYYIDQQKINKDYPRSPEFRTKS